MNKVNYCLRYYEPWPVQLLLWSVNENNMASGLSKRTLIHCSKNLSYEYREGEYQWIHSPSPSPSLIANRIRSNGDWFYNDGLLSSKIVVSALAGPHNCTNDVIYKNKLRFWTNLDRMFFSSFVGCVKLYIWKKMANFMVPVVDFSLHLKSLLLLLQW